MESKTFLDFLPANFRHEKSFFIQNKLSDFEKLFNKKVPMNPKDAIIPTNKNFVFKFRDLIFFKLEPKNRVGLQNIRN